VRRVLSAWVRAVEKAERGTVWGRRGIARKEGVRGGGHHGAGGEGGGAAADRSRGGGGGGGARTWAWVGGRCRFTEASGRCRLAEGRTRGGSLPLRALIGSIDIFSLLFIYGRNK
jgi:hypothetical protein